MKTPNPWQSISLLLLLVGCAHVPPTTSSALNLADPTTKREAWARVRTSLDAEDVVYYFSGRVYPNIPKSSVKGFVLEPPLFHIEGYNVARRVTSEGRTSTLTREVALYEDPKTGEILECWANPLNGKRVSVVHVWNDPVNFEGDGGDLVEHDDTVEFHAEVVLAYPSPLRVADYPENSASDVYQGAEMFNFVVRRSHLEDPSLKSVPANLTWTRFGPFLPWMQMAQAPGGLIYQASGYKLPHGYADLPERIRRYVEAREPLYTTAPTRPSSPNATSWRYFKALAEAHKYKPTCE